MVLLAKAITALVACRARLGSAAAAPATTHNRLRRPAAFPDSDLPAKLGINVPVFRAVGANGILFCGLLALRDCSSAERLRAQKAPYFSPAANLSTYVLPNAGHSLGLHQNADQYRNATRSWLGQRFGLVPSVVTRSDHR